jgi:hypothetical protein
LLIDKVAGAFSQLTPAPYSREALEKVARASDLLKQASEKITQLEEEVSELKLQIFAKERSRQAVKLAQDMAAKGLIKQSALGSQVDYIMGLDEEGFRVLNKTVGDVPVKKVSSDVEGVEKLSCLFTDPYVDVPNELPSLEDVIITLGK